MIHPLSPRGQRVFFIKKGELQMILSPMDVLTEHQVRKTKRQKEAFRADAAAFFHKYGYGTAVERGSFGAKNLVAGNPETAQFLITAHYDTCAWMPVPNFITPCNFWLFLITQLILVLGFFLAATLLGVGCGFIFNNRQIAAAVAYLAYFLLLGLMMFGPANRHTANDNTSGVVTVMEIAKSMPENLRDKVCFVLFDLEEAGLIGSASYRKKHKVASAKQVVINLDCVGDGDEIVFFPSKAVRNQSATVGCIKKCAGKFGKKRISVRLKGFSFYPSDQQNFPYGIGVAALRRSKLGLYMGRIHTHRDTILDQSNVNLLRAAIITMVDNAAQ